MIVPRFGASHLRSEFSIQPFVVIVPRFGASHLRSEFSIKPSYMPDE
jgi:hypothetical protein